MYIRISEENGPADPALQGIVSEMALLPADLVGILIKRAVGRLLTIYARSYAIDPIKYLQDGVPARVPMANYNERLKAKSKAVLVQEARLMNDIISKSEEHFSLSHERDMTCITSYYATAYRLLLSLQHRAWTWL
jgi:hypothetical protein